MLRLRELRKANNLTVAQTAQNLNIPFETYRSYEIGRNQADYDTLLKLASYFNVSVDYLLGREVPTLAEKAAGASATRKESITPIEDELLYTFRQVGKKHGEDTQKAIITMIEKML